MNLTETLSTLIVNGFVLVGSRSVFPNEDLNEDTDYDFMQIDSQDMRDFLERNEFFKCIEVGKDSAYFEVKKDTASTSIWKHPDHPIEVVLKVPEKFQDLKKFWHLMKKNPEAFKTKFWKSYEVAPEIFAENEAVIMIKPNTSEKIALELAYFLNEIIPYVEV